MLSLKNKVIDSKESLINPINILDTLGTCAGSADDGHPDKNSENEFTNLRTEVHKLLDEVNYFGKVSAVESSYQYDFEYLFEEISFRERVSNLEQKIALLQRSNVRPG